MFWLLTIGLIIGGALCIPSLIASKSPEAAEQMKKIAPYQGWIGIAVLVNGILGIFTALRWLGYGSFFVFSLALLISAIVAIVIGILLGYGLIQTYALKKASDDVKAKAEESYKKLQTIQVPAGIAGICVGLFTIIAYFVF